MNQPVLHQIATYLTNYVLSELVKYVMYVMEDTDCGNEQAMEKVYKSPLMEALQDEENEFYMQSPAYLYEMMNPNRSLGRLFISFPNFLGLFMPYQHFFMFHDVIWARHSKQACYALVLGNVRHLVHIPVSP